MKNLLSQLNPKSLKLIQSIGVLAQSLGMKAYLVGGPVRDLLMGFPNVDLDITVQGPGIRLAEAFAAQQAGSQVTRYRAFKTATVHLADGSLIDFATCRKEVYVKPGAYPVVESSNIMDDLCRRDFTINAMAVAINPETWGQLIDPFKGKADVKAKRLRILHDQSFLDDPTRILRAARFKARFGLSLEAKTLQWLKSAVKIKVLDTITPQRYLKDFNKVLKEPKSLDAIKCLKSWDAYRG